MLPLTRELKRVLTRLISLERAANSLGGVGFQRVKLASPATLGGGQTLDSVISAEVQSQMVTQ